MSNQVLKEKILEHFFKAEDSYEVIEIGDYATINTGNSIPAEVKEKKYSNLIEGYNYIGTKDVNVDNTIEYENGIKIPFDEGFKVAKKNDILLCIEGGSAGKKLGFLKEDVCFGNKLCRFSVDTKVINSKYLFYYMQSKYFIEEFESRITGIIGGVSTSRIKKIKIAIPNISKQEEIADKLTEIFKLIEQKEKNDTEIENLKEKLKNKVLEELDNNEYSREKLGNLLIKSININWKDASEKEYNYIDLTSVDREKSLINKSTVNTINKTNAPSRAKQIIKTDDILYGTTRPTQNRICIVNPEYNESICSTGFCVIRHNTRILSKWIFYNLKSKKFLDYIKPLQRGVSYPAVSDKDVKNYEIAVPPIEEQERKIKKIEKIFELIDRME